jgi:hypothetical protein
LFLLFICLKNEVSLQPIYGKYAIFASDGASATAAFAPVGVSG